MTTIRWILYGLLVAFGMVFGYESVSADYQYNAIFSGVLALIITLIIPFCVPRRTKIFVTIMAFTGTAFLLMSLLVYRLNPKELVYLVPVAFGLIAHFGAALSLKDFGKADRIRDRFRSS
ncbi:MAG: hypothetical protein HY567_03610 [Candidatus Kerfeldbacteria bacterium]|nr:hypothetical protein [Candidatus Kerfeldbacteria bacterium]